MSAARKRLAAVCAVVLLELAGCQAVKQRLGLDPTRALADRAEALAVDGDPAAGLALVERAVAEDPGRYEPFLRDFTRAWLRQTLAPYRDEPERSRLRGESIELYRAALEVRPADPQASKNLALVLRDDARFDEALALQREQLARATDPRSVYASQIAIGDLLADLRNPGRDPRAASSLYSQALASPAADEVAPGRIVQLHVVELERARAAGEHEGSGDVERRAEDLLIACDDLAARYFEAARDGYEALMSICGAWSATALTRWVELQARSGELSVAALSDANQRGLCAELVTAVDELARLIETPLEAPLERTVFWSADRERVDAYVQALRALARAREFQDRIDEAGALYGLARRASFDASREVFLDVALDLAILYHAHRSVLDPDRAKLAHLIGRPPLDEFGAPDAEVESEVATRRSSEELQRVHTIFGLMFSEMDEWRGRAQYHLERAVAISASAERGALPRLSTRIGRGLGERNDPFDPLLAAARGYVEADAHRQAADVYDLAAAEARDSERKLLEIEKVVYPRPRWYAGASGGFTFGRRSAPELESELEDLGHDTDVTLDDQRDGWKLFVGYRFDAPFAIEAAWVSLDGPESSVVELSVPPATGQLSSDLADIHPLAGRGVALALRYLPFEWRRFTAFAKAGVWWWEADLDVGISSGSGNSTAKIDRDGVDPLIGVGLEYRATRWIGLRAELERYFVEDDGVDFLSIGISGGF